MFLNFNCLSNRLEFYYLFSQSKSAEKNTNLKVSIFAQVYRLTRVVNPLTFKQISSIKHDLKFQCRTLEFTVLAQTSNWLVLKSYRSTCICTCYCKYSVSKFSAKQTITPTLSYILLIYLITQFATTYISSINHSKMQHGARKC